MVVGSLAMCAWWYVLNANVSGARKVSESFDPAHDE